MVNICFFSGDITRGGGTERVATDIVNGLSRLRKYNISILSLVEQKKEPFYIISSEVKRFVLKNGGKWVAVGIGYLQFVPTLKNFLKLNEIDIIVDIDLVLDLLVFPAALGLPVKVISWEHFNYFYERSIWYRRAALWFSIHFSDCIITLTERDRQNYRRIAHRRKRIIAIDNPLGIRTEMDLKKEKVLITVGQLIYRKGIDMLVQIIPRVLMKHKDWKWYFLGNGEYRRLLKDVCRYYKLEDRLILTGEVKNVEDYLKRSAIMVMGSREEGLGMCLLEARACRVPCVAFDIPVGPLELIDHGLNGFLVSPFDLDDMVEKINLLIEDEELRERFMGNTLAGMEKYQLTAVLRKWTLLLDEMAVNV